jgi:hypothetical protein
MTNDKPTDLKNVVRSVAYPAVNLQKAVDVVRVLHKAFSDKPFSRESATTELRKAGVAGNPNRLIAACVHFGLLERRDDNTYGSTPLATDVLYPQATDTEYLALRQAVQTPRLFSSLITDFDGKALPGALSHILVRSGVSPKVADEVAQILRESLEHAKILANGIVNSSTASEGSVPTRDIASHPFKKEGNGDPFATFFSHPPQAQKYSRQASGHGWAMNLEISSREPLSRETRRRITELFADVEDELSN